MTEQEDKGICEDSNIIMSPEYKEDRQDIFFNTAILDPEEFPNLFIYATQGDLIDEIREQVEEKPFRKEEEHITAVLKKEHGITYSFDDVMVEMKNMETDICLANELVEDPHTIFSALTPREINNEQHAINAKPLIIVASHVDPEYRKETGTACEAVIEGLTTGVVQDSIHDKTDTPAHGLSVEVKCVETDLQSK